ncbi:hypothetical protein [Streptomyces sp. NPDC002851]
MAVPHPRETRAGAGLRLLRAVVFAAVCVALSAGGHAIASCASVPLWSLGVGFLAVFAVAAPLAGRARTLPGIAAGLAVGQLGLHALFGIGQHCLAGAWTGSGATARSAADAYLVERAARLMCGGAAGMSPADARRVLTTAGLDPAAGAASGAGHQHGGHAAADAAGSLAGTHVDALLPDVPMLLGHLLAAAVTGWLLRRGDLALLRLMELSVYGVEEGALVRSLRAALALVRSLRTGLPGAPAGQVPPALTTLWSVPEPRTTVLEDSVIRRGPPRHGFHLAA